MNMEKNWHLLDEYEQAIIKWQYKLNGGFYTHLWAAICVADGTNLERLQLGFPIEVIAYKKFIGEKGWYINAENKWKGIKEKTGDELDAEIAGARFKESMKGPYHNRTEE